MPDRRQMKLPFSNTRLVTRVIPSLLALGDRRRALDAVSKLGPESLPGAPDAAAPAQAPIPGGEPPSVSPGG